MTELGHMIAAAVQRIVRPLLDSLDYLALYPAVIVAQDDDGTLHVAPDDDRIPGMTGVRLRTFLPGVEVKVRPGGRVLVGWEHPRDPAKRRPVAHLFDGGSLDSLTITAQTKIEVRAPDVSLADGGLPVARQGDMVACGGAVPVPCLIQLPTGPNTGAPQPATITFAPLPLYGLITSGRPTVKT